MVKIKCLNCGHVTKYRNGNRLCPICGRMMVDRVNGKPFTASFLVAPANKKLDSVEEFEKDKHIEEVEVHAY